MRKVWAVVGGLGLVSGLLTAATAPASAGGSCEAPLVTTTLASGPSVSLGPTGIRPVDVVVAVDSPCPVSGVQVTLDVHGYPASFALDRYGAAATVQSFGHRVNVDPANLFDSDAGAWATSVAVTTDAGTVTSAGPTVSVLRATRLTVNATPEPVKKGRTITVKGSLQRAGWEAGANQGYGARKASLQFRTTSGSYATVKTVTGSATGAYSATVKAARSGCFRYVYAGDATSAAATVAGDCVKVK